MNNSWPAVLLLLTLAVVLAGGQENVAPGKQTVPETKLTLQHPKGRSGQSKAAVATFHAGPWEQSIGYSQAVRVGHMLYISGTVGADSKGQPEDLDSQMKNAYQGIQKTLAHFGTNFSHVMMERIYTTDMEALIGSQETRKHFYGEWLPAATWVEVKRLYGPGDKIEIEVQVALD